MISKQSQSGGDQSTNVQVDKMVVHLGIDEKRAREVFQEMNLQLRREYTKEALDIANARVSKFESSLLPKMDRIDGALEAFADPGFQLLLADAQKTAASTERQADYDLLSELLIHRFQKGDNRIARAGISVAVGIVDKVSDDALTALTVAHAVSSLSPVSGDAREGLDVLNNLFGKIICGELPSGQDWLDHLDTLNAVRLTPHGTLKKTHQYYPETLHGYIDAGIEKNSTDHETAKRILTSNGLPEHILVEHIFNSEFLRIPIAKRIQIASLKILEPTLQGKEISFEYKDLSEDQKKAVNSIYDLYSKDHEIRGNNTNLFMQEWDKRPHLKRLKEWWDSIPGSFTITSAGKVLAHANAQRCDNTLPPLN